MKNYIQKIRQKIGREKLIHPAARIIIENETGQVLCVERSDNGQLGLPAGALEESETIAECIAREVFEETGLTVLQLEVIGISTSPDLETVTYANGDTIQYFTVEFYSNQWEGKLHPNDPTEVKRAKFMAIDDLSLPAHEHSTFDSLCYYRDTNSILLK